MLDLAPSPVATLPDATEPVPLPASSAPARERAAPGRWRRSLDAPRPRRARAPWVVALLVHAVVLGGGLVFLPGSPLRVGEEDEGSLVVHATADAPALEADATPEEVERRHVEPDHLLDPAELDPTETFESTPLPVPEEAEVLPEVVEAALPPETAFPSLEGLVKLRVAPRAAAPSAASTPMATPAPIAAPTPRAAPAAASPAVPAAASPASPPPVASGRGQLRPRFKPVPAYPEALRQAGIEGVVVLRIVVEADGTVSDARVVTSSGFADFDRAAIETIRQWRFEAPGERRAVDSVPIRFRLR